MVPDRVSPSDQTARGGASRLAEGYQRALAAADILFGAFVVLMVVIAGVARLRGDAPLTDLLALVVFLAVNLAIGEAARRVRRPYLMEILRLILGGIVTFVACTLVTGPLAPWWQGFMVMSLGGAIGFGLLTQKPLAGRIAVGYYVALYVGARLLRPGPIEPYGFALEIGIIATVGLMFAEIMSLLGETLQQQHARGLELKATRDALFAEMEVAQEIQTLLLPKRPTLKDCEVAGRMVTASEVGGDYYDIIESESGRTLLAIGDVSGHGVSSGLTMMMARTALVGALESAPGSSLAEMYRVLNRCIAQSLNRMDLSMFMTFALIESLGAGRYAAVGQHLPLLIYRRATRTVEEIDLSGIWLGVLPEIEDSHIEEKRFALGPGDVLFLYTDGVVERFGAAGMFGFERLKGLIVDHAEAGPNVLIDEVLGALGRFSTTQEDDVTMLVVRYAGSA